MSKISPPKYSERRISAREGQPPETVKSAVRVLQILEFFDDIQREATVMEVAKRLSYPQSSTSVLLKSMTALGYLEHDPHLRKYIPSARVALLGSWLDHSLIRDGDLLHLMKELNRSTGDTIVLIARYGLKCQYIHVIQATSRARLHLTLGSTRSLVASGGGYALLSQLDDSQVISILHRHNADQPPGAAVSRRELLAIIGEARKKGYAFNTDTVTPGGGILAAPLPFRVNGQRMAVGIGGISNVMREREGELAALMKEAIANYVRQQARISDGADEPDQSDSCGLRASLGATP